MKLSFERNLRINRLLATTCRRMEGSCIVRDHLIRAESIVEGYRFESGFSPEWDDQQNHSAVVPVL